MSLDLTYIHLIRAIRKSEECFLCTLEDEIESKYIDTYLSELVMDASCRQKIIESRGFCNNHFYKMLIAASKPRSPDGHGIALLNQSIIEVLIQDLHKKERYRHDDMRKLLTTENKCPACIHLSKFTKMYVQNIIELLSSSNEEFQKLLKESKGFCIPHFLILTHMMKEVMSTQSQKILETLTEIEEKNLRRLNSELTEYIKKQSYEFSEKERITATDILLRSVEKIVGRRGIKLETIEKTQR